MEFLVRDKLAHMNGFCSAVVKWFYTMRKKRYLLGTMNILVLSAIPFYLILSKLPYPAALRLFFKSLVFCSLAQWLRSEKSAGWTYCHTGRNPVCFSFHGFLDRAAVVILREGSVPLPFISHITPYPAGFPSALCLPQGLAPRHWWATVGGYRIYGWQALENMSKWDRWG